MAILLERPPSSGWFWAKPHVFFLTQFHWTPSNTYGISLDDEPTKGTLGWNRDRSLLHCFQDKGVSENKCTPKPNG